MGKKKAAGPSVDELVNDALVKVATAEGPLRLSGKGDHLALFKSTAGAGGEALARLQDPTQPLVEVVGDKKAALVRLTAAGFRHVLPHIPEEKVGGAAKAVASSLPAADRADFLNDIIGRTPLAAAELLPLYEEAVATEKAAAEVRATEAARRREREEASRKAMVRWLELADERKRQRIDALTRELEAEGGKVPTAASTPHDGKVTSPPDKPGPVPREDIPFRRDVAGRLVSTWLESFRLNKPEGRLFLETAMGNMRGVRQIGEEGERVPFDGKYHEADASVPTGTPVRVVRPGWVLDEDDGEYRLAAAKVSP